MSIKSLNRLISQVFQKTTLQTVLMAVFGLQILTTGGVIGYLSFRNGQQGIDNLVQRLQKEASQRIEENLDTYLAIPPQITHLNQQALELGLLDLQDFTKIGDYFWQQMRIYPLSSLGFGNSQGEYMGIERAMDNQLLRREITPNDPNTLSIWRTDSQGKPSQLLRKRPQPHSYRSEAWYTDAVHSQKTTWSQIERCQDYNGVMNLSIAASSPLYGQNNTLVGVLSSEYHLSQIHDFLKTLEISPTSQIFIVERNGMLVAGAQQKALTLEKGQVGRVNAPLAENTSIRQTSQYLIKRFQGLGNIQEPLSLTTDFNHQRHFIQVTPWRDEWGLNWLIVVTIPESDFIGEIHQNTQRSLLLSLLALGMSGLLAWLTSRWLTRPLAALSAASRAVQSGNLEQTVPEKGSREIRTLAQSFNLMIQEIAQSRQQLEIYSQSLEKTVQERTQAWEREMRDRLEAETLYYNIFNHAVEGIYRTDIAGKYLEANPALAKLYGYDSPEELKTIQPNFHQNLYVDPRRRALFQSLIDQDNKINNFESQVYRRDGAIIWIAEHARVFKDEQGKVLYYEGFVEDITARKDSLKAMKKAKIAAEKANLAKSTFIAHISHELRSPLNAILGFSQVMLRDIHVTDNQKENLNIILRSGEHLLSLINEVLDLSKIEAGQMSLNPKNFDLWALLGDMEDMFSLRAVDKGLSLMIQVAEDIPSHINTDEMKLRQVLINLLSNALKFTKKGEIILKVKEICRLDPTTMEQSMLHFEVTDTGEGIAPEELKNLFQPFVQTQTGLEASEGAGLGLTISRKFVQLMGGDIEVRSQIGQGTTFAFDILVQPVTPDQVPRDKPKKRVVALAPNSPGYRILVVDDKPYNRQLLIKLLQPLGFELQEAANGQEAIQIWETWEPHLIWMDMRMPVLNGYQAATAIKQSVRGQATAIIALTASVLEKDKAVILSSGCDDFLRKPFREAEIFSLMGKHLGVNYVYDSDITDTEIPLEIVDDSDKETFQSLPQPWRDSLEQAIQTVDLVTTTQLLQEIAHDHNYLYNLLKTLIDEYEYQKVLDLISVQSVTTHDDSGNP